MYGITDQASSQGRSDEEIVKGLIEGGITVLQYRAKKVEAAQQYETALKLRRLSKNAGLPFVINDRIDLAVAVGADGIHLGQDDLPLRVARKQAPGLFVGKSTHSLEQAHQAEEEGADYIGCGPLYATKTKENNVAPVGCGLLKEVLKKVSIPVVAIGGIKPAMLEEIAETGATNVAVVTHLTAAREVRGATAKLLANWRKAKQDASATVS